MWDTLAVSGNSIPYLTGCILPGLQLSINCSFNGVSLKRRCLKQSCSFFAGSWVTVVVLISLAVTSSNKPSILIASGTLPVLLSSAGLTLVSEQTCFYWVGFYGAPAVWILELPLVAWRWKSDRLACVCSFVQKACEQNFSAENRVNRVSRSGAQRTVLPLQRSLELCSVQRLPCKPRFPVGIFYCYQWPSFYPISILYFCL